MPRDPAPDLQDLLSHVVAERTLVDLTDVEPVAVVELLALLVGTGAFLLHGTNRETLLDRLEPGLAWDASRASGRQRAVYATSDWIEALFNALLNRDLLVSLFGSIGLRFERRGARHVIALTAPQEDLLPDAPWIWSSGMVCVLRRKDFIPSPESDTEFICHRAVQPVATMRVSPALSSVLIGRCLPGAERKPGKRP